MGTAFLALMSQDLEGVGPSRIRATGLRKARGEVVEGKKPRLPSLGSTSEPQLLLHHGT